MPVALYYPHTTIRDPRILKNALLLWDHIECITPAFGKRPHWFDDQQLNEATQLIVRDHVPSRQERSDVHEAVVALVRRGIPEWFQLYPEEFRPYPIYPDKLPNETWGLLEDNAFSTWRADGHAVVSEPLGLLIMSLLADACAGSQKQRVTDRADAYSKLNDFLVAAAGGVPIDGFTAAHADDHLDALIALSIPILDAEDIPLQSLIDLRHRELRESGTDLKGFRQRYAAKVAETLVKIATEARTDSDRKEILSEFEFAMRDDFNDLKADFGFARSKALTSREVIVTAAAMASMVAAYATGHPVLGTLASTLQPVTLGSLLSTRAEFAAAKRKALRSHAMSWLYLASAPRHQIITRQ